LGIELNKRNSSHAYWDGHQNPLITKEILRAIPKTDLNCRLDGSVSVRALWQEILLEPKALEDFNLRNSTIEKLQSIVSDPTLESEAIAKRLMNSLLQNEAQIERGLEDVIKSAVEDGVIYLELMLRPEAHLKGSLKHPEEVLELVLDRKRNLERKYPIRIGVIVFCNPERDDPIEFRKSAEWTVQYREKGLCGFGVLGSGIF